MNARSLAGPSRLRTFVVLALLWYRIARAVYGTSLTPVAHAGVWGIPWPFHLLVDLIGMGWLAGGAEGIGRALRGRPVVTVWTLAIYVEAWISVAFYFDDLAFACSAGILFVMALILLSVFTSAWFRPNPRSLPWRKARYSGIWEATTGAALMASHLLIYAIICAPANPGGLIWIFLLVPDVMSWLVTMFVGPRNGPTVFLAAPPPRPAPHPDEPARGRTAPVPANTNRPPRPRHHTGGPRREDQR